MYEKQGQVQGCSEVVSERGEGGWRELQQQPGSPGTGWENHPLPGGQLSGHFTPNWIIKA